MTLSLLLFLPLSLPSFSVSFSPCAQQPVGRERERDPKGEKEGEKEGERVTALATRYHRTRPPSSSSRTGNGRRRRRKKRNRLSLSFFRLLACSLLPFQLLGEILFPRLLFFFSFLVFFSALSYGSFLSLSVQKNKLTRMELELSESPNGHHEPHFETTDTIMSPGGLLPVISTLPVSFLQ